MTLQEKWCYWKDWHIGFCPALPWEHCGKSLPLWSYSLQDFCIHVLGHILYSHDHDQLYKHICLRNDNNDTIKTSDSLLEKYSLTLFDIGPAVRVFANGPGDLGSIPGRVIPKTLKMELDTTLLNTQHYKVRFKGKVEQSREWSSALPYTLV